MANWQALPDGTSQLKTSGYIGVASKPALGRWQASVWLATQRVWHGKGYVSKEAAQGACEAEIQCLVREDIRIRNEMR